jgi:chemotaxis protein CheD
MACCHHALPTVNLLPGDLFCDREPHRLHTILGSCVAVCLWDRRLRFGGMNHFVLPSSPDHGEPSSRFGDVAISALIDRLTALGSEMGDLEAKLFGGASVLHTGTGALSVGSQNIELATAELHRCRIPVVASRLSGREGVVVIQCTACGDVWVRPIATIARRPASTAP